MLGHIITCFMIKVIKDEVPLTQYQEVDFSPVDRPLKLEPKTKYTQNEKWPLLIQGHFFI
jgi:hypothetical protein